MSFLIAHYLIWIIVALLLGVVVAWMAAGKEQMADKPSSCWLVLGIIAAAIFVAFTHAIPGRIGHGLEVALLLLVAYLMGCLIGEPLRLMFGSTAQTAPRIAEPATALPFAGAVREASQQTQVYAGGVMAAAASTAQQFTAEPPVSDDHKPLLFAAPPAQGADDLKLIWGVGPKLETLLNQLGVYRFAQIADWNEMNLRWVDQNLEAFKGRATRDRWIQQSKKLAGGWRPQDSVGDKFEG